MAATEERDVPELQDLVTDLEGTMKRYDEAPQGSIDWESEVKNTLLPLMKDLAESTMLAMVELRDIVDPVTISTEDAQEIGTLLAALRESQPGNAQLVSRIDAALAVLSDEGDDDEEGDEEEDTN